MHPFILGCCFPVFCLFSLLTTFALLTTFWRQTIIFSSRCLSAFLQFFHICDRTTEFALSWTFIIINGSPLLATIGYFPFTFSVSCSTDQYRCQRLKGSAQGDLDPFLPNAAAAAEEPKISHFFRVFSSSLSLSRHCCCCATEGWPLLQSAILLCIVSKFPGLLLIDLAHCMLHHNCWMLYIFNIKDAAFWKYAGLICILNNDMFHSYAVFCLKSHSLWPALLHHNLEQFQKSWQPRN